MSPSRQVSCTKMRLSPFPESPCSARSALRAPGAGGMPAFVEKEMLGVDGARKGFFPHVGKIPLGTGKLRSSLTWGAEPGCCDTPPPPPPQQRGVLAIMDHMKDLTGAGKGLWQECCAPGSPALTPSASCYPPSGLTGFHLCFMEHKQTFSFC